MQTLQLATFPLDGLQLIEASAGTGKTYTLSNLYLRYLLEKQYLVDQILVVTFTEAATKELRDRVRSSIVGLLALFEKARVLCPDATRGAELPEDVLAQLSTDTLLKHLLQHSVSLEQDALRLRVAERQIDTAEIHTIHGFCQKVIRENALLLKLSTRQTLQENPAELQQQVVEDLWRRQILGLPKDALQLVTASWKDPVSLLAAIKPLLSRHPARIYPALPSDMEAGSELCCWLNEFNAAHRWYDDLAQHTLEHAEAAIDNLANSDVKSVNNKIGWIQKTLEWARGNRDQKVCNKLKLDTLTASALAGQIKKGGTKWADHTYFVWLEKHLDERPSDPKPVFLPAFLSTFKQAYEKTKRAQGILDFDDLIMRLYDVLGCSDSALQMQLVSQLRAQFSIALIDEFQDTDRHQYAIFDRVFGTRCTSYEPSMVLIGDPKQAIYGFRGGDMATYLKAKRAVENHAQGEQYGMGQNWRSSPAMVNVVNRLFEFRDNPFLQSDIPFHAVDAAKKSPDENWEQALHISQLLLDSEGSSDDAPAGGVSKADITLALGKQCVSDIVQLLEQAQTLSIKSSDIAILVRDRTEAEQIRYLLAVKGIKACFDDRTSIFTTNEARAVLRLLCAVSDVGNDFLMRQCLADPLFQIPDEAIEQLDLDSAVYLQNLELFQTLHDRWVQSGVRNMVQYALNQFGTLNAWAGMDSAASMWERSASNILQLLELLQEKARSARTPRALLDWLQRQISLEVTEGNYEMRLESDDDLIRIVTIHKSKGLEYKVVHLPFVFSGKNNSDTWFYDADDNLCVSFDPSNEHKQAAIRERLAEDMRLLYVALTRSRYRCYIGTAAYSKNHPKSLALKHTAFGFLLGSDEYELSTDEDLTARLQAYVNSTGEEGVKFSMRTLAEINYDYEGMQILAEQGARSGNVPSVRVIRNTKDSSWKIHSFTGLMHEHEALVESAHKPQIRKEALEPVNPNKIDILNFPRGSQAGTFLHTLFESLDFESGKLHPRLAMRYESVEHYVADILDQQRLVPEQAVSSWAKYLSSWVLGVLGSPLIGDIELAGLETNDYLVEANFHFSVNGLSAGRLNSLIKADYPAVDELQFSSFEGHVKGAVDLMFRHNGKYYILDYKSNHLGFCADDYSHDALQSAISEHRYDLQYLLYTIALHRQLKHRLGAEYDYDTHIGGAIYLFLRGMSFDNPDQEAASLIRPGVFFDRPSKALVLALDDAIAGEVE